MLAKAGGSDSCSKLPAGLKQPTHFDVMTKYIIHYASRTVTLINSLPSIDAVR